MLSLLRSGVQIVCSDLEKEVDVNLANAIREAAFMLACTARESFLTRTVWQMGRDT